MTEHEEYAAGLRKLADWVELHPEVPLPMRDIDNYAVDSKEEAVMMVRALGTCNKVYSDSYLTLEKSFGPLRYRAMFSRGNVCRRVVVGSETIPAKFIEAHVEPARTKEVIKWECDPILEPTAAAAA